MSVPNFGKIIDEATYAANVAGDEWVASHTQPAFEVVRTDMMGRPIPGEKRYPMLDVCGFAYVEITDKRTAFAKYVKKTQGSNHTIHLRHKYYSRQEWSLNEACAIAALRVFRSYGLKGLHLYSRID